MVVLGERQAGLYAAETAALGDRGLRWPSVRDVRRYVDGLVASDWFAARWPHLVAVSLERRGRGSVWSTCRALDGEGPGGRPTEAVVLLADGALVQHVVLHELAHLLGNPGAGHDRDFAALHLALVRHEMGFFAYAAYRRALWTVPGLAGVDDPEAGDG